MSTLDVQNIDSIYASVDTTPKPETRVHILLNHYTNELTQSLNEMRFALSKFDISNIAWAVKRTLVSLVSMHKFLQKELSLSNFYPLSGTPSQKTIDVLRELDKELNNVLEYRDTLGCSLSSSVLRLRLISIIATVNDCLGYINGSDSVLVSTYIQPDNSFITYEDSYKGLLEELASVSKDEEPIEFIEL